MKKKITRTLLEVLTGPYHTYPGSPVRFVHLKEVPRRKKK